MASGQQQTNKSKQSGTGSSGGTAKGTGTTPVTKKPGSGVVQPNDNADQPPQKHLHPGG
jgi:hypothetical protein